MGKKNKRNVNKKARQSMLICIVILMLVITISTLIMSGIAKNKKKSSTTQLNLDLAEANANSTITSENYGDNFKYSVTVGEGDNAVELNNWSVYYADGDNVYIIYDGREYTEDEKKAYNCYGKYCYGLPDKTLKQISSFDYLESGYYYGKVEIYDSAKKFVDDLNNTKIWSVLLNDSLINTGAVATGASSVELYVDRWNELHPDETIQLNKDENGYSIGSDNESVYRSNEYEADIEMYLAGYTETLEFKLSEDSYYYDSHPADYIYTASECIWIAPPDAWNYALWGIGLYSDYDEYCDDYELNAAGGYVKPVIAIPSYLVIADEDDGWKLNTEEEETETTDTTSFTVTKKWDDGDNANADRPESVNVTLYRQTSTETKAVKTVSVSSENDWKYTFENLPKYNSDGEKIEYTCTEDEIEGYSTSYEYGLTVDEEKDTVWSKEDDGTWESVGYYDDEQYLYYKEFEVTSTTTLSFDMGFIIDEDDYYYDMDVDLYYSLNGDNYSESDYINSDDYTEKNVEIELPAGTYKLYFDYYGDDDSSTTCYIKNVKLEDFTNEYITNCKPLTSFTVTKKWNDGDNTNDDRPESVNVTLYSQTSTETVAKAVETVSVSSDNDWKYTFENLPKYDTNGQEIIYTCTEDEIEGYTTSYDYGIAINEDWTHWFREEDGTWKSINNCCTDQYLYTEEFEVTSTTTLSFNVVVMTNNTENDLRLWYMIDGVNSNYWNSEYIDSDTDETVEIELPAGKYFIKFEFEVYGTDTVGDAVAYVKNIKLADNNMVCITNTATTDVTINTVWNDADNIKQSRPDKVTLKLYRKKNRYSDITESFESYEPDESYESYEPDESYESYESDESYESYESDESGELYKSDESTNKTTSTLNTKIYKEVATLELLKENSYEGNFENVPIYDEYDEFIDYIVVVDDVENYTTEVSNDLDYEFTVTLNYVGEIEQVTTSVTVKKTWKDANNAHKKRPTSVLVRLYSQVGNNKAEEVASAILNESNGWKYKFKDLPVYGENNKEINYYVEEDSVLNYKGIITRIRDNTTNNNANNNNSTYATLADVVEVGDYVNYDASSGNGAGLSYTTESDLTGSSTTSTFSSSDSMKWRVLSIDKESGTVELMSADPTSQTVRLYGKEGYKNAETVLNKVGEVYGSGNGATGGRSIKLEDVEQYSSYDPYTYENSYSSTGYYGGTRAYTSGTFVMEDGSEVTATAESPVTMTQTCYGYASKNYFANKTAYNMIFKKSTDISVNKSFWLASRCVYLGSSICEFYVHGVFFGRVGGNGLFNSGGTTDSLAYAVSAVVSLKSNIQTTGQDSSGAWNLVIE